MAMACCESTVRISQGSMLLSIGNLHLVPDSLAYECLPVWQAFLQ
ncbi:hypothetical protein ILFOPFJJ_00887 [Ensifer psoraleae]|nr:hypothetical protein [Sinorhizobium psoraleae]